MSVEFKLDTDRVSLDKRNYNHVFENFSFAERKEEWKEVPLFNDAYSQWRTKFTDFMVNIQDPQREKALKTVLSSNKEAKDFTATDADTLFNEFCRGKSDITKFVMRVTANPANLSELLPHLQWIASGLFGKNTASQAVTRLVELESALHNNPVQVIEVINSNKERINTPTDDERKVLGLLRDSLPAPQETVPGPTQEIEPTITAIPAVSKPAPVIPEPIEEDEDQPPAPPPPPPPPISQTIEAGVSAAAAPPPAQTETLKATVTAETEPEATVEIVDTGKESELIKEVRLKINENETGLLWDQLKNDGVVIEGIFWLGYKPDIKGNLLVPKGIRLSITSLSKNNTVRITGGKEALLSADDLKKLSERPLEYQISLTTKNYERWEDESFLYSKEDGRANYSRRTTAIVRELSIKDALDLLFAS